MKIKQIEWYKTNDNKWICSNIDSLYFSINFVKRNYKKFELFALNYFENYFDTLEEAQQKAQELYEDIIKEGVIEE